MTRPGRRRRVDDRQLDRQHPVLEARAARARDRRPRPAGPGAGTARTRSPSAGRRDPVPSGASARLRSRARARLRRRARSAGRRRAARRRRSARAGRPCGSSRRSGRKPWRSPEKRGTCQRSANSSSISSCSLSTSRRVIQRERYPAARFDASAAPAWSVRRLTEDRPWRSSCRAGRAGPSSSTRAGSRCSARPGAGSRTSPTRHGDAAYAGWALLVFALLAAVGTGSSRTAAPDHCRCLRVRRRVAFVAFVGALFTWFGWLGHDRPPAFTRLPRRAARLELLCARGDRRRAPRLPLPAARAARRPARVAVRHRPALGRRRLVGVVTLFVGLVFLAWSRSRLDAGPRRPYGFWLHVGAGLLDRRQPPGFWHGGDVRVGADRDRRRRLRPARRGARPFELGGARHARAPARLGALRARVDAVSTVPFSGATRHRRGAGCARSSSRSRASLLGSGCSRPA